VERGAVISRVSTNARFRIRCDGDLPPGLSADLCIKGYFVDCSDTASQSRSAGEPEALFYRELGDRLGVRTLPCVYAEVDPVTHHGVVVTEDVVADGAVFLDALSPYSLDQVAQSLDQLAQLHARTWGSTRLQRSWLNPRLERTLRARGLKEIRGNFEGPIGARIPDEVRDPERLMDRIALLSEMLPRADPPCLLHGDAHVGNLYLNADGRPCLVDWQLVQRGPWYLDVGYHLGCAMTKENRRHAERELLGSYMRRLEAEGGAPPSWDEAWRRIAVGMLYGFYLWAITLKVRPAVTTVMLERLGAAVADHQAYSSVLEDL
jgi:thiamine kinase-like enzyme